MYGDKMFAYMYAYMYMYIYMYICICGCKGLRVHIHTPRLQTEAQKGLAKTALVIFSRGLKELSCYNWGEG